MRTKVKKWGNSLALRIPKAFALEAELENNSVVEVSLIDGQLVVKAVTAQRWSLEQLLSGVTKENIHQEIITGDVVGNEVL